MSMQQVAGLISGGAVDYQIDRSVRFNSADSAYLSRTPSSAGNRKTWTWSSWVKRGPSSTTQTLFKSGDTYIQYYSSTNTLYTNLRGGATNYFINYANVYRDPSAWYHVVVAVDTTQATAADRQKVYVNGVQLTDAGSLGLNYPPQNDDTGINNTAVHYIGGTNYFDGYLADVHFIDGQALSPSDFGELNDDGVWNPKRYSGSYGTNGFHLDFSDNSSAAALGTDTSGNSNTWTVNNLSVASGAGNDSLIDTPTNYEADSGNNGGNYCTWNPLKNTNGAHSEGNLKFVGNSNWCHSPGTFLLSSGKWYFEGTYKGGSFGSNQGNIATGIGFIRADAALGEGANQEPVNTAAFRSNTLAFYQNGYFTNLSTHSSVRTQISEGDVVGVSINFDTGTYAFYVNNSSVASGSLSYTGPFLPWTHVYYNNSFYDCNFGQRPFAYTPPTGHKSLCTTNLTDPTIADGSTAMDVALWTGNSGTQTISGLGFSPDLVWGKCRSHGATSHHLTDAVRGANKSLFSNANNAEVTYTNYLTAFTSDGFTLGSGSELNYTGRTFVGWAWDGGTTTATNNNGSIQSTVRANPSAGFSIVTWTGNATTGATVGHGLNSSLGLYIIKNRDATLNWITFGDAIDTTGANGVLILNTTATRSTSASATASNNTTFPLSGFDDVNGNNSNMLAYCFAPVAGYSAFGSYTGNGSSDGPFVYTGFRPRWLMIKSVNYADNWLILDAARETFNVMNTNLRPNTTDAETVATNDAFDFVSNGFKIRGSGAVINTNGAPFIYAAFAEHPFKTARAR